MDAESLEMLARSSCTAHPQSFGGAPAESSCKHEHSHIVDSKTHGGGYAGPVSRRIFCSHCRLQRWLDENGLDLEGASFYSDSLNDLPLLEKVSRPVAVDPDPRLRAEAEKRGWPIISLR